LLAFAGSVVALACCCCWLVVVCWLFGVDSVVVVVFVVNMFLVVRKVEAMMKYEDYCCLSSVD